MPSQQKINNFLAVKTALMTKSPFGYFTLASDKINSLEVISTSSPSLSVNVMGTSMKILDLQDTETLTGSSTMDLIRNIFKYGLYILFLGYLIFRITNVFSNAS